MKAFIIFMLVLLAGFLKIVDQNQANAAGQAEAGKEYSVSIFVQHNTNGADEGFTRLVRSMEGNGLPFYKTKDAPSGIIGPDDVVILKVNGQWAERGGTNVDLVRAVAQAIGKHPESFRGEVIIADNGQGQYGSEGKGGSLDWGKTNSLSKTLGFTQVVEELKPSMRISRFLWDTITLTKVKEYDQGDLQSGFVLEGKVLPAGLEISYAKFATEYGTKVSFKRGVWDERAAAYDSGRLKVINMPVLKYHGIYQVTGAIKNYMGTVANQLAGHRPHNSVGRGGMGAQMGGTRMPALNIMDMIWIGVTKGPGTRYEDAVEKDMIAASVDPVALDWWAAKYVLLPEAERLRPGGAKRLDPDNAAEGSFGHWLRLSRDELEKAGVKTTLDPKQIKIVDSQ